MNGQCRCGAEWSGTQLCHCSVTGCHRNFGSLAAFDAHKPGRCLDPAELVTEDGTRKWHLDERGVWRGRAAPKGTWAYLKAASQIALVEDPSHV